MSTWFRKRKYLHFDRVVDKSTAQSIVMNSKTVAQHAFYPFIQRSIIVNKIYRDKITDQLTKKPPKQRKIMYASHIDSHIYGYYSHILSAEYENLLEAHKISPSVLAFRKLNKNNINFALEAFQKIRLLKNCTVLALDISGFFDNLDHNILKQFWCKVLNTNQLPSDHFNIFKSLTKFAKVDEKEVYKRLSIPLKMSRPKSKHVKRDIDRLCQPKTFRDFIRPLIEVNKNHYGIPQGSSISPILSNIYMLDFDKFAHDLVSNEGGYYFRYCDDILIIVPKPSNIDWEYIYTKIKEEIQKFKLVINSEKEEIRQFTINGNLITSEKPLQYLGFEFNNSNIYIRSSSMGKFSRKMRKGVRLAKLTMIKHNKLRIKQNKPTRMLYRKKLYKKYSYIGNRNFISYGLRAAKIMESDTIRKQLKPLWKQLKRRIEGRLKRYPYRLKKANKKLFINPADYLLKTKRPYLNNQEF
jgi:RNA-directed DNA polymerase